MSLQTKIRKLNLIKNIKTYKQSTQKLKVKNKNLFQYQEQENIVSYHHFIQYCAKVRSRKLRYKNNKK